MGARERGWVLVLAAAVLAGCGDGDAAGGNASGGDTAGGEAGAGGGEGTAFIGIAAVEGAEGADGSTLRVRTEPLPVDEQAAGCAAGAVPRVEEHPAEVTVYVDLTAEVGEPPYFEGCTLEERSVALPLAAPIGERRVTDAFGSIFWQQDGRWVGCDHVVMTCITDPASCDNGTLRAAISNADVPRHFGMDDRCEEPYAVVDIDVGAGACPAPDGGPNPCAGERLRRTYWRIEDEAWVQVALDQGPGCGAVPASVPDFPTHLCEDLPALPGSGD